MIRVIVFLSFIFGGMSSYADLKVGERLFVSKCVSCHGTKAEGQGIFPRLTNIHTAGIISRLRSYKYKKERGKYSSIMWGVTMSLNYEDMMNIANYVKELKVQTN